MTQVKDLLQRITKQYTDMYCRDPPQWIIIFYILTIIPQGHLHTYTLQRLMAFIYVKIVYNPAIMLIFIRSSRSTLAITGRNLALKCTKCNLGKSCIKSTERADWAETLQIPMPAHNSILLTARSSCKGNHIHSLHHHKHCKPSV